MDIHQIIKKLLQDIKKPIFIEIGAHYGEDTVEIMKVLNDDFEYHVFEPDPRNIPIIKKNGITSLATLHEKAVGGQDGKTTFHLSSGNIDPNKPSWTGSSSIKKPKEHLEAFPWCKFDDIIEVDLIKLDTFFAQSNINRVDFLWLDTQGAEFDIIEGGQWALHRTRYLYSEYYDSEMYEEQKPLNEWFKKLPGRWRVLEKFPNDVLLINDDFPAVL